MSAFTLRADEELLAEDHFCGAGGVTSGIRGVAGWRVVHAANHDPVCIATHSTNCADSRPGATRRADRPRRHHHTRGEHLMHQPLPTLALPAPDDSPTDGERAPIENTAKIPDDRRGACWYALMRDRHAREASDHPTATWPRPRAVHWSRTPTVTS